MKTFRAQEKDMRSYNSDKYTHICGFCTKEIKGHPHCENCLRLIHDMTLVKNHKKYDCSVCGINHVKASQSRPTFCTSCAE